MTDISAQKWAERTEARKALDAREAKKQQEEFIDIVSHEMRNPLSAITMSADSISKSFAEVKALGITEDRLLSTLQANVDSANIIITCANHQKRIVDDVLTLSKLEYMMLSITTEPVKLQELVGSSLKMFELDFLENRIQAIPYGDLSIATNGADWVSCDPSRVTQIIVNFLTNAIKFTKTEKKREINVRYGAVTSDPRRAFHEDIIWAPVEPAPTTPELMIRDPNIGPVLYLTFAVQDSGVGMSLEEMQRLFGRFAQANVKTSIKYGGSGLGLFICKKFAEKMGGEIGVMSEAGKGSTFVFYIEAHKVTAQAVETHIAEPAEFPFPPLRSISNPVVLEPSVVLDLKQIHVLLVEDNEINQRVLAGQLKKAGCTVTIANHGGEALERLKETRLWRGNVEGKKLDIILMDWEMPVMDGLTCAKEIRKWEADGLLIGPHIEIIGTTANAREEQLNIALKNGIVSQLLFLLLLQMLIRQRIPSWLNL
jgi:signal transduction histidine kinase/CheY-like chemotaxis protein